MTQFTYHIPGESLPDRGDSMLPWGESYSDWDNQNEVLG